MSTAYTPYKTAADLNYCLSETKYFISIAETGKSVQYQILYSNSSQYKSSDLIDILAGLEGLMGTIEFAECFDKTRVTVTKRDS